MDRAKNRTISGYSEKHHIIPRCMNGDNKKDNLVRLTAREHFVAHLMLTKIYPDNHGLIGAAYMMTVGSDKFHGGNRNNNRRYDWLKRKFSEHMSVIQSGENNSQYGSFWMSHCELKKDVKVYSNDKYEELLDEGYVKGRTIWKKYERYLIKKQKMLIKESVVIVKQKRADDCYLYMINNGYEKAYKKFNFNNNPSMYMFLKRHSVLFRNRND